MMADPAAMLMLIWIFSVGVVGILLFVVGYLMGRVEKIEARVRYLENRQALEEEWAIDD